MRQRQTRYVTVRADPLGYPGNRCATVGHDDVGAVARPLAPLYDRRIFCGGIRA